MRVIRSGLLDRRAIALLCSAFVLLHILVVHPLPDTHHAADEPHLHGVVSTAAASALTIIVQSPDHVTIACASAEWVMPRIDVTAVDGFLDSVPVSVLLALFPGLAFKQQPYALPLPDGPGRQAVLQVFRL